MEMSHKRARFELEKVASDSARDLEVQVYTCCTRSYNTNNNMVMLMSPVAEICLGGIKCCTQWPLNTSLYILTRPPCRTYVVILILSRIFLKRAVCMNTGVYIFYLILILLLSEYKLCVSPMFIYCWKTL